MKVIDVEAAGRFTIVYYGTDCPYRVEWKVMVDDWGVYGPKWIYKGRKRDATNQKRNFVSIVDAD